jgi:hypothetical protein
MGRQSDYGRGVDRFVRINEGKDNREKGKGRSVKGKI